MNFVEILITAVALAMDAFAVAVTRGLDMKKFKTGTAFAIAISFALFQALMPLAGYFLGARFEKYIVRIDHWLAFFILGFLGVKMLIDGIRNDEENKPLDSLNPKTLLILSVATSIDALAVGITFAFLNVNLIGAVSIIGFVTLVLSFAGVAIGYKLGGKLRNKAEILGGVILIVIGLKILLEHLGVLPF